MFKYFFIPATSTEAERVFSALGNILTKKRLSMIGENVDKQFYTIVEFHYSLWGDDFAHLWYFIVYLRRITKLLRRVRFSSE